MSEIDTYFEAIKKTAVETRAFLDDKMAAGITPLREELARLAKNVADVEKIGADIRRQQLVNFDGHGRLEVQGGKFHGMSPLELSFVGRTLDARRRWDASLVRPDTMEAMEKALTNFHVAAISESMIDRFCGHMEERMLKIAGASSGSEATEKLRLSLAYWRTELLSLVRKALDSATTSSGKELIATLQAAELWMDVNLATLVLPLFPQQPMPSNPFDMGIQFGDVNWWPMGENAAGTTTTPTTAKSTLTAYEVKSGVPFSDTLDEDSIVALMPEIRSSMARNAAEVIDDLLLNADTTTGTTNLNFDGGTLNKTTPAGKAHYALGFEGMYKLPMVNNTAQRIRVAGALANTTYNNLDLKLGKYAIGTRRGESLYIVPVNVWIKSLQLAQVETQEKYGPRATISSGELASIYGKPMIVSTKLGLVDTTGSVRSATSNNTTGRIIAVNTSQWRVGFRREMTFEAEREAGKGQTTLWMSFRIAFIERTGTRSTATHTAAAYDISSVT